MQLFLLLLLTVGVGYWIATTDFLSPYRRVKRDWRSWRGRRSLALRLKTWVLGDGAASFSSDLRDWLAALPAGESEQFSRSLLNYMRGMQYDLEDLLNDDVPDSAERARYIEMIIVYSDIYRKTRIN